MLLMIISPRLFNILFEWDLLGLVSYCLVIYYYEDQEVKTVRRAFYEG